MVILGVVLLIIGIIAGFGLLTVIGVVLIVCGLILGLTFRAPYAGQGAAPWYHRRWY